MDTTHHIQGKSIMRPVLLTCSTALLLGYSLSGSSPTQGQVLEPEPVHPIQSPADARTHSLGDLRKARMESGGLPQPDLSDYLRPGSESKRKLEQLGKLLYWDTTVGSEGMSCASCH